MADPVGASGSSGTKTEMRWDLDAGIGFDVAGANTYRFEGLNPGLAPLNYEQLGLPLPDAHLGVGYTVPLPKLFGGSNVRFAGGLYGNWERVRSDSDYDSAAYDESCEATEGTDGSCVEEENNEADKNTFTAWRNGLYLSAEFTRPIVLGSGFEIPLGLRVTERFGVWHAHNAGGEFYAGGIMPHNEGEEHAVIVDNQTRIGAILGFVEAGVTIDGGTNSKMNSDIGYKDMPDAAYVSSGYPTTLTQTGGQFGAYVEVDVGRIVMAAVKSGKKD